MIDAEGRALMENAQKLLLQAASRIEKLEAALKEIETSKYQNYENTSPDSYGTGVTDGHRYCGKIARDALVIDCIHQSDQS